MGKQYSPSFSNKAIREYYFEEAGEYEVILNVEDDEGVRSSSGDMVTITVNEKVDNGNPVLDLTSPSFPPECADGLKISLVPALIVPVPVPSTVR